jgi:hypothetical protein
MDSKRQKYVRVQAVNCRSFSSENAKLAAAWKRRKERRVILNLSFPRRRETSRFQINCANYWVPACAGMTNSRTFLELSILVLLAGVGVEGAEAGFDGLADDSVFDFFFQLRDSIVDRHHAEVGAAGV